MKQRSWKSYSEFHQQSRYATFSQRHRRSLGRFPFSMIHTESGPHDFEDPSISETLLALPLDVETGCRWSWQIDERVVTQTTSPRRMLVVPPDVRSIWRVTGKRRMLTLCIPNASFRAILNDACPRQIDEAFCELSADTWEDEFVEQSMELLCESCAVSRSIEACLADGIIASIAAQLILKSGRRQAADNHVWLPEWRLRKVREHVEANLTGKNQVDELASVAGLSKRHFSRAFHRQLGATRHQWLTAVKIDKARKLLANGDGNTSDIAETCGFSSEDHFCSIFKKIVGVTPVQWRKSNTGPSDESVPYARPSLHQKASYSGGPRAARATRRWLGLMHFTSRLSRFVASFRLHRCGRSRVRRWYARNTSRGRRETFVSRFARIGNDYAGQASGGSSTRQNMRDLAGYSGLPS